MKTLDKRTSTVATSGTAKNGQTANIADTTEAQSVGPLHVTNYRTNESEDVVGFEAAHASNVEAIPAENSATGGVLSEAQTTDSVTDGESNNPMVHVMNEEAEPTTNDSNAEVEPETVELRSMTRDSMRLRSTKAFSYQTFESVVSLEGRGGRLVGVEEVSRAKSSLVLAPPRELDLVPTETTELVRHHLFCFKSFIKT